jgi:hypothetical protein
MKFVVAICMLLISSLAVAQGDWEKTNVKGVFVDWTVVGSCARITFQNRTDDTARFAWRVYARPPQGKRVSFTADMHEVLKAGATGHVIEACGALTGNDYQYELEVKSL